MSGGKKRSGFQITSVTSDFNQSAASVSQGSSSQPTTPCLKRKYGSHDASGQGVGSASRFRVVRLAAGAASGRGETSRRGRWTCTDFMETQDGFRRIMDSMRHAHSLESLELIDLCLSVCISPVVCLSVYLRSMSVLSVCLSLSLSPVVCLSLCISPVCLSVSFSSSSNSLIAIDNKIEQAMDLVKSHLMLAVREEVELLREQIRDLQEKNQQLQRENHILRTLTHNTHTLHNLHNLHKLHNT
uniref:TSC22 domain family, member 2 n=1 Tax=Sander lucioperca TaxID=283035 RepID=A0A8C9ZI74_SANLU